MRLLESGVRRAWIQHGPRHDQIDRRSIFALALERERFHSRGSNLPNYAYYRWRERRSMQLGMR